MLKLNFLKPVLLLFIFTYTLNSNSQSTNRAALTWFDNIISQNNLEINAGVKYMEEYMSPKGNHHFLLDDTYHQATVEFNKQTYYNIPVKYDIYSDNLIVKIDSKAGSGSIILNKKELSSFTISNQSSSFQKVEGQNYFQKVDKQYAFQKINNQFFEKKYQTEKLVLLKKYYKLRDETIIKNLTYSKFKPAESYYLLTNDNTLTLIESKSSWLKLFPDKKKEIKKFYRQERKLLKTSENDFYTNLIGQILK